MAQVESWKNKNIDGLYTKTTQKGGFSKLCVKIKKRCYTKPLVSKRFGFWPHITHVIVLTFKEIKHLSNYRTVGLSDRRTIGHTRTQKNTYMNNTDSIKTWIQS
jgi:hypothetical protein